VGIGEIDKSLQKLFSEMVLGVGESSATLVDPGRPFWGLATQGFGGRSEMAGT
jgi:hypothetical protein